MQELYSEEVQEVMNKTPSWIIRSGIFIISSILMILFIGSYFFKYPDSIQAEVTITTLDPPVSIISFATNKIDSLFVFNNQRVKTGEILAVIQNTANSNDVIFLSKQLFELNKKGLEFTSLNNIFLTNLSLNLGPIQPYYASVLNSLNDYENYRKTDYYTQKISSQQDLLICQTEYYEGLLSQIPLVDKQYKTSYSIFARDSLLYVQELLSDDEYDIAKRNFLQDEQSFFSFKTNLKQTKLQVIREKATLMDLEQQAIEIEARYKLAIRNSVEALHVQIKNWEREFLLVSPIDGAINFMGIWSINQNVELGETVFTVIPESQNLIKGKALLPIQGAGKVKKGQKVHVRLNNFPDKEFGFLVGNVISISNIPTSKGFYIVEIDFASGMKTNYNIELPISQQMHGNAEIMTDNLRLLERLYMPIKKVFMERIL